MIDLNARRHHGRDVTLSVAETLSVLETAPSRVVPRADRWSGDTTSEVVEIEYQGQWLQLGRTDLFDDVATGVCKPIPDGKAEIRRYSKRVWFGARVHDGCFSVVDSLSDG